MNPLKMIKHLIIGGGIAGVSIAVKLLKRGESFLLLESSDRLGGKIETKRTPEACLEMGPSSFTDQSPEIFDLLDALGLKGDVLEPSPAAKNRFILKEGRIVRLQTAPPELITSGALSPWGRIRFLWEAVHVASSSKEEESVWGFFARHFGREAAEFLADPFVSGVYAGDARRLSFREAFPSMAEAEARSSSLIRHLFRNRRSGRVAPKTYQLKGGLGTLVERASGLLGEERFHRGEAVREIVSERGSLTAVTERDRYLAETIYLTSPAPAAAKILERHFGALSRELLRIEYAPLVSIHLRVSRREKYPFDGFGLLIPSCEQKKILGVLWHSSIFPDLFPDKGHHYLGIYAGGVRHPEVVEDSEERLRDLVLKEVQRFFSLRVTPEFLHLRRHRQAIPQYQLGYGVILQRIREELSRFPSLRLAGNYLEGVSLSKTAAQAMSVV